MKTGVRILTATLELSAWILAAAWLGKRIAFVTSEAGRLAIWDVYANKIEDVAYQRLPSL